ncbi:MAG TPA: hypothetical protein PK993_03960 [Clostridia bacterium]|nr:hypothetical protein [Clostridia bacterium]
MKTITIYTAFMLFILISMLFYGNNINTKINKDNIIFEMSILKTENMEEFDLTPINIKSAGFLFLWGCTLIVISAYFWDYTNTKTNNL